MTATIHEETRLPPHSLPRLLPDAPVRTLRAHHERYGAPPVQVGDLVERVERSGLTGHGGAGFPAGV